MRRTTYIDDISAGNRSPEKLAQLVADIVELCKRGGFETKPPHMSGQDGKMTTLGLIWHKKEDSISIKFQLNLSAKRRTLSHSILRNVAFMVLRLYQSKRRYFQLKVYL